MDCRRAIFQNLSAPQSAHAGLWMDKFLSSQTERNSTDGIGDKQKLIEQVAQLQIPEGYREAFELRERSLKASNALVALAAVQGRMAVGLGAKGSLETGLRLEHTWGVPVIPGSALKGLAAATANLVVEDHDQWKKPEGWPAAARGKSAPTSFQYLFGTTDGSGHVIFQDAWWKPEGSKLPIHLDVMTVHHPAYYQQGSASPSDFDSPIPIPFASVSGKFLVALEGEEEWLKAAFQLLEIGLAEFGIGAKTSSGYGRLALERTKTAAESGLLWQDVTLTLDPGKGELYVDRNGQRASADKALTDATRKALPAEEAERFNKRKLLKGVDIEVKPAGGKNFTIIRVIPRKS